MIRRTKVWAVRECPGYNAADLPIKIQPGTCGWMDWDDAVEAEREGLVDIMVGKTPQALRDPVYQTVSIKPDQPKRRGPGRPRKTDKRYTRSDLRAET